MKITKYFKIFSLMLLSTTSLQASSTTNGPIRVGNGDNGEDLESFEQILEGPIVETRMKAVELLRSYQVSKIEGLGNLIPEVENTKLYLTKKGLSAKKLAELGAFTNNSQGLVYARTMPAPYSATRFFPSAQSLNEKQLISLHIHEGLHRALAPEFRESEEIAMKITEVITVPSTSRDKIAARVKKILVSSTDSASKNSIKASTIYVPETSRLKKPSKLSLETRHFQQADDDIGVNSIELKSMYLISSHLYPFGENDKAFGLGFDFSVLNTDDDSFTGPLSLSARYMVYTARNFDVEVFGQLNLNTLSQAELKTSLIGRDTTKLGITLATRRDYFFIENDFFHISGPNVEEEIGNIDYTYTFGQIYGVNLRAGTHYKDFMLGGFTEILVSDNFKVQGGDFEYETGRNRMLSWGPYIEYRRLNYSLAVKGRFLIDSSKDTSYEYLSNIMEYGVGQGSVQTQLNVFF